MINFNNKYTDIINIVAVFFCVNIAWIFFRMSSLDEAVYIIKNIFLNPGKPFISTMSMVLGTIGTGIILLKDFLEETGKDVYRFKGSIIIPIILIVLLIEYILLFGILDNSQYIYFQF